MIQKTAGMLKVIKMVEKSYALFYTLMKFKNTNIR